MIHVVSFYCPRPEHPFFQDYRPFLNLLRLSCERHGCTHRVLTDDAMLEDAYLVDVPRSLMPAFLAAQHQWLADPANAETPTLLVGADCVLTRDPACFDRGGDVVVTVDDRFTDCRINMGAVYVPCPAAVAHVWADALARCGDEWGDDQRSFRDALEAADGLRIVELPCDDYNRAPDNPGHDCTDAAVLHFRGPRKGWMQDYCRTHLGLGEGFQLKTAPNTSEAQMLTNVQANLLRHLPEVRVADAHDGHAVIVGGGPSLADTLPEIRWRKGLGQTVFALNGAAGWLLDHDVAPDYGVILDPRLTNARFLRPEVPAWLLASQCHPELVASVADRATLWHYGEPGAAICDILPAGACLTGGAIVVGLCVLPVIWTLGYRNLHLYGYDSSEREGQLHAYEQAETRPEAARTEAFVDGRWFVTNAAMFQQAQLFQQYAEALAARDTLITVHGDGLLPTIAHVMARTATIQEAA